MLLIDRSELFIRCITQDGVWTYSTGYHGLYLVRNKHCCIAVYTDTCIQRYYHAVQRHYRKTCFVRNRVFYEYIHTAVDNTCMKRQYHDIQRHCSYVDSAAVLTMLCFFSLWFVCAEQGTAGWFLSWGQGWETFAHYFSTFPWTTVFCRRWMTTARPSSTPTGILALARSMSVSAGQAGGGGVGETRDGWWKGWRWLGWGWLVAAGAEGCYSLGLWNTERFPDTEQNRRDTANMLR